MVTVPSALRACRKPSPFCLCLQGGGRLLADTEGVEGTVTPVRHDVKPSYNDQPTGTLIVYLPAEASFASSALVTHKPEGRHAGTARG